MRSALLLLLLSAAAVAQFRHRSAEDLEIRYWLLDPAGHQFRISHDFTVTRVGQKSVHSFVRKGSVVAPDSKMFDLDTGEALHTHIVTGKEVNALSYYPNPQEPDTVVVQGDLPKAIEKGESVRIRVEETYTDPVGYTVKSGELDWTRTLGRPLNYVTLPEGWMLTGVNTPAVVTLDPQGRVTLRFTNIRPDQLSVSIRARKRP